MYAIINIFFDIKILYPNVLVNILFTFLFYIIFSNIFDFYQKVTFGGTNA